MDLAGSSLLQMQTNDPQLLPAGDPNRLAPALEASQLDALGDTLGNSKGEHHQASRFDDILGQTLAGPLFATWSPTAAVVATAKSNTSTSSNVSALDSNGRRDGRKRSRR
jgi:hypothetical protein